MRRRFVSSGLAFALACALCSAGVARVRADPAPTAMTLEQALAYALEHHPRLLVDRQEIRARAAEARIPSRRWLPKLGVTAQAVGGTNNNTASLWLGSRGAVEMPRIAGTAFLQKPSEINWKPYLNTAIAAGFEQELFDFGRIAAEQAARDARARVSKEGERADRLDVELGVREAFLAVQAAHQVRLAAEQAVQRASVHRDAICSLGKEGLRPAADCERGRADLARYQAALSRADGSLAAARVGFAASMGHERDEIDVAGEAPSLGSTLPSFEQTIATSVAREPRMRVADAEVHARKAETRQVTAQLRPQVYAIGTMLGASGGAPAEGKTHGAYGRGAIPFVPDYYLGVVLAWRAVDAPGWAERDAAEESEKTAARRHDEAREHTKTDAAQAWVAADSTQRTLPELENALRAAEINYAKVDGRYSEGLATIIELADAEALRVDAQINLVIGRFEVARSRARLDRALAQERRP